VTLRRLWPHGGAIAHYRALLAVRPQSAQGHYDLASVLAAHARAAEAIGHYGEALRLRPEWPAALDGLAASYAATGRWDEAVATAEHAVHAATAAGDAGTAAAIRERLDGYRVRRSAP